MSSLLLLAPLLTGCQCSSGTNANTLIYGRNSDANELDPINTDFGESVKVLVNIFDTLIALDDKTMKLKPSLATNMGESSDDGKTWTFQLRKDVTFHDGEPFNADAVVYSFERLLNDKHPGVHNEARPYRPNFTKIVKSVEAVDEHTVKFHLHMATPLFIQNLAMFPASIVSPTAVEKHGADFTINPVGTGPFQFDRWQRGERIILKAFDNHWRGRPSIDHVVFLPITETATIVQKLERGEIHIADNLPPSEVDIVSKQDGIVAQEVAGRNVGYLSMQTETPGLDNVKVRQAIDIAINREDLINVAYNGYAEPAVTMVPKSMKPWHNEQLENRPFDLEKAKALLEQAADEGVQLPLKFDLAVMSGARPYMQQPLQVATYIKDALAKIGIEVSVTRREAGEHFQYMMAGKHQLGLAGWSSDNNDPDNFLYNLLDPDNISEAGNNMSRYRNDRVHELLLAGQVETDLEKRKEIYNEAQQIIFNEAPVAPLVHTSVRIVHSDKIEGYVLHPSAMVRLRSAKIAGVSEEATE